MHQVRIQQKEDPSIIPSLNESMVRAARNENPDLGAFTHLFDEDQPGNGFGAAIKANIAGNGFSTHCGSRMLQNYSSSFDSTAVSRLRNAGGHFMGITTMDEFGMGSSCEHTTIGKVCNPWDQSRTAGGSSGGSAAAVAAGLAWFGLGSDTGGSVRLPAHYCGIVGLKPTWGRISRWGLVAFASSLDTIGILGRDVKDAYHVFLTLAGHDPRDATTLREPVDPASLILSESFAGLKVGIPNEISSMDLDEDVRRDFHESIHRMEDLGACPVPVSLGSILESVPIYTVLSCAEAASNLHRFDGSLYGSRIEKETYHETLEATRNHGFGPEVKRRLLLGAHVLSGGYQDQYYLRARAARQALIGEFKTFFSQFDLLALPTATTSAFPLGSFNEDPVRMYQTDILTVPASLAGLPALTLPTSLDRYGLPLSLQLVGPSCSEKLLLESGLVLENQICFRDLKEAPWNRLL